jgi:hypothetical protein
MQGRRFRQGFRKDVAVSIDGTAIYASSIQDMATSFQRFLEGIDDAGFMILDSRNKGLNTRVSHSKS